MSSYSIYTGRVTNRPLVAIAGAAVTLPLLLLGILSEGDWVAPDGPGLPLLTVAVAGIVIGLTGLSVRTTAGPNGVSVHCGMTGWPRRTYRLGEIQRAEVAGLSSSLWRIPIGYWWTTHETLFAVRTGEVLRLTLRSGRTVRISVPDPRAAVAVLGEARPSGGVGR